MMAEPAYQQQWRFCWPHAKDREWQNRQPTPEEVAEWREDLPNCWVERRVVTWGSPERVEIEPEVKE